MPRPHHHGGDLGQRHLVKSGAEVPVQDAPVELDGSRPEIVALAEPGVGVLPEGHFAGPGVDPPAPDPRTGIRFARQDQAEACLRMISAYEIRATPVARSARTSANARPSAALTGSSSTGASRNAAITGPNRGRGRLFQRRHGLSVGGER